MLQLILACRSVKMQLDDENLNLEQASSEGTHAEGDAGTGNKES